MISYQIKNYRLRKEIFENFQAIKIVDEDLVFYAQPVCLVEYGKEYKDPYLVKEDKKLPVAIDKSELVSNLARLKLFHLKSDKDTGEVTEVDEDNADISIRLPKETKVKDLEIRDGQIYKIERKEATE